MVGRVIAACAAAGTLALVSPRWANATQAPVVASTAGLAAPPLDAAAASSHLTRIPSPLSARSPASSVPRITPVDAASFRHDAAPRVPGSMDPSKRTRILRGALIGGLAGFVLIGLYGTIKEGLCDAAKCPSAARYTILGSLGGAALGALAGAADP
jgi:hypothetical protein